MSSSAAAHLPLEQLAFWPRLFGIIAANTVAALIVVAVGLLRWGPVSAGYVPVVGFWAHYALLLGSNSFAVTMPERLALIVTGAIVETVQWCAAAGGCS